MTKTPKHLKRFETGQLCYVVYRRFEGKGPYRLLLHDAKLSNDLGEFTFGSEKILVVNAPKFKPAKVGFKPQSIKV